jgi:predicted membrane protein
MKYEEFESFMDTAIKVLAIVAGAVAIVWIIIPGIILIVQGG